MHAFRKDRGLCQKKKQERKRKQKQNTKIQYSTVN